MQQAIYSSYKSISPAIDTLVQEIHQSLSKSRHQLTMFAHGEEALDCISRDFSDLALVCTRIAPGNLFEPHHTEKMYRELKGATPAVPAQYWEQELQSELDDFQADIALLERLDNRYIQHIAETCSGREITLTFVVSRPGSPLMAVYKGSKAMVYNFSC